MMKPAKVSPHSASLRGIDCTWRVRRELRSRRNENKHQPKINSADNITKFVLAENTNIHP
jgi:hypothetical protein